MKIFLKYYLPFILWAGLIFYLSSLPNLKSGFPDVWDFILRKAAHMIEFGILAILALRIGLKGENQGKIKYVYIIVLLFCILYAASDEYHQSFVGGRQMALRDVLIDSLGIVGGSGIYLVVRKPLFS
ncbi:MAG: VanZ family protein [Patescibacteria group bacterium]